MIVYVGNMLSTQGYAPTSVETIGEWLGTMYPIKRASPYRNQSVRILHMCWVVFRYRKRCRLIVIDTYSGLAFTYAIVVAFLARLFDIKYIPVLHGGNLPLRFERNPVISQWFIRNAYYVIAPSDYLKRDVESRGWGKPVLIPNAVNIHKYNYIKRDVIGPYLLWVRSFHEIYNPLMALEVLRLLRERGFSEARLCMIGPDKDGSMKKFKERASRYGLDQLIEVTGKLSKEEWIKKSSDFDIFINTTNFDNTPVSVIEAMALGFPVVSTNVGGIPFLLKHKEDALLVDKGDSKQMCDSIIDLIKNPELCSHLSIQARKKAEQFSWEQIKVLWIDLLVNYSK